MKHWKKYKVSQEWRRGLKKITAAGVAAAMISSMTVSSAFAGPPVVDTDETLYVNLDYYGAKTHTSVVKGCSLNGIRSFTDYGTYTDVTNMSGQTEPEKDGETVTWNLPEDSKERFYYECQLEDGSVALPWDFDISYRLNGVPVKAEELAGASGLVDIDIECTANRNARDYYKNNMLLQVAALVDMQDVSSIQAPGSQTQSVGTYKAVIFAAVPGESKTFHMEIGTSAYESSGIFMMMIPGKLDQMKELKDIKGAKDAFSDSANELVDSLNEVLGRLDSVTSGMLTTKEGLEQLKQAKSRFDANKDAMSGSADQGLDELAGLTVTLNELSPDIIGVQDTMNSISDEMNGLVDVVRDSEDDFSDLGGKLGGLKEDIRDLQSDLSNTGSVSQEKVDKLQAQVNGIQEKLGQMSEVLAQVESGQMSQAQALQAMQALQKQAMALIKSLEPYIGHAEADGMRKDLNDAIDAALHAGGAPGGMDQLNALVEQYFQTVEQLQGVINELQAILDNRSIDGTLTSGSGVLNELSQVSIDLENAMAQVEHVNDIKNRDQVNFDNMLNDTASAAQGLANSSGSLVNALRVLQNTLKANRADVENGTGDTIDGLISILEETVESSGTDRLQNAGEGMRSSIKEEVDKVENDTNLLSLDAEEDMISFTSDKNGSPASIQVILKTQEIHKDSVTDHSGDIEPQREDPGIWNRIVSVFEKIWNGIKRIF